MYGSLFIISYDILLRGKANLVVEKKKKNEEKMLSSLVYC